MPSLTAAIMGARDPVQAYLQNYYYAQNLSENREERKRQLAEQQLRMTLAEQERQYRKQKDEQASLEGAVGDLGNLVAAHTIATGQQPDETWLQTTWRQVASQKGLDINKYPNPGPYGVGVLDAAKVQLDKMQREAEKQKVDLAKKEQPLVRDFPVGDQTVPKQWNPQTGQWDEVPNVGGPRYKDSNPPTPRFTVQQGQDAQGNPVWVKVNNMTGEVAPVITPGVTPPPRKAATNDREVAQARAALTRERAAAIAKPMNFPEYMDANGRFSDNLFQKRAPKTVLAGYPEDVIASATGQAPQRAEVAAPSKAPDTPPAPGAVKRRLKSGEEVWVVQTPQGWLRVG